MRRALVGTALAVALSAPIASASADSTVVVPGLAFPDDDTYLTYFGCEDLYHADSRAPQVRIDRGAAPAGSRSFGLLMPGAGTAAGPVHLVDSVADTTVAGFSARAANGGSGVAYVWYVTPELLPGQVWAGRADLSVGSSWTYVNTRRAPYTWELVTAATGAVVRDGGTATIADFTDDNGDGPGYMLAGFGCDGEQFSVDRLRFGARGDVTTFDLEGIAAQAEMSPLADTEVAAGDRVALVGSAVDALGAPLGAAMVLEAKPAGADDFRPVGDAVTADADGFVRKVVNPEATTTYRWYLPAVGYADASWSDPVTIVVDGQPTELPSEPPGNEPSEAPSEAPTEGATEPADQDTVEVPPLPTTSPDPAPTDEPSETPGEQPSETPSDLPSDQPTTATP